MKVLTDRTNTMAKETFYFSHDYNARTDIKIRNLIRKHSMLGYGIYWAIIEDLYNNGNRLPTDYDSIAYELRVCVEVTKSVINSFDLFTVADGYFSSDSVKRRLEARNEKVEKAKNAVKKRWEKYERNTDVLPTYNERNTIKDIKESKVKDSKVKDIKEKKVKDSSPRQPEILFRDSEFFDFKKFEAEFIESKYNIYNLEFYYESVLNWSNSRNAKKVDWIATARNFMIGDAKENKAVLKNQNINQYAGAPKNRQQANLDDYKGQLAAELGFTPNQS